MKNKEVFRILDRMFYGEDAVLFGTVESPLEHSAYRGRPLNDMTEQILRFMRKVTFNAFRGAEVAQFMRAVLGLEVVKIRFGVGGGSPVLYLTLRAPQDPADWKDVPPMPPFCDESFHPKRGTRSLAWLLKELKKLKADELTVENRRLLLCDEGVHSKATDERGCTVIRAWWD